MTDQENTSAQAETTSADVPVGRRDAPRKPNGVPDAITILFDGLTIGGSVREAGEVIEVTDQIYADSLDREGNSIFDLSDKQQVERYRRVVFARGDISGELRKAAREAEKVAEAVKAKAYESSGLQALRDCWREEDEARKNSKLRWQSRTIARKATTP